MPVKFTLQPQIVPNKNTVLRTNKFYRLQKATTKVTRGNVCWDYTEQLRRSLLRAKLLPCCHFRCHRHSTVLWHCPSCTSAQRPQHGSESTESSDHGTLLAIYRFSSICRCQSSLTATTELRKCQQRQYFNGNSLCTNYSKIQAVCNLHCHLHWFISSTQAHRILLKLLWNP